MNKTIGKQRLRVGFLLNPYAGIGGEAGLKGSDGADIREKALHYSSSLRSPGRAQRFLAALGENRFVIDWYAGKGMMGEVILRNHGVQPVACPVFHGSGPALAGDATTAADTRETARFFLQENVDLLLFVGGDGTARDVLDIIHTAILSLGIPAGVKMQSGVFALSPEAAAEIVTGMIESDLLGVAEQDVRDIDEAALREGRVRSCYYGSMCVPAAPMYLQHLKQGGIEDERSALEEIAAHLTEIMEEGHLMLAGPGRTVAYWMETLGLSNTLVGFDAVLEGRVIQSDLNASDVVALQSRYPGMRLVLSPTGQQGMLIGRGNQQLTPLFLRQLPKAHWLIVATKNKLAALQGKPLIVDSNDYALDQLLCGLYNIISAYHYQVLYPVNITYKI